MVFLKLSRLEAQVVLSALFFHFLVRVGNRQLCVVLDVKSLQEHLIHVSFPEGPILGPTFFLNINDLPDVVCSTAIYADNSTSFSKYYQASYL